MADKIIQMLGGEWVAPQERLLRRWLREFYAKRSEIHGEEATTERWPYWAPRSSARYFTWRSSSTCSPTWAATGSATATATMPTSSDRRRRVRELYRRGQLLGCRRSSELD
jgi:hypothetical protein